MKLPYPHFLRRGTAGQWEESKRQPEVVGPDLRIIALTLRTPFKVLKACSVVLRSKVKSRYLSLISLKYGCN